MFHERHAYYYWKKYIAIPRRTLSFHIPKRNFQQNFENFIRGERGGGLVPPIPPLKKSLSHNSKERFIWVTALDNLSL